MKTFMYVMAAVASVAVTVLFVMANNSGVAAIWGVTSGVWIANAIGSFMEG